VVGIGYRVGWSSSRDLCSVGILLAYMYMYSTTAPIGAAHIVAVNAALGLVVGRRREMS
jgi:hypothetical protein